MEVFRGQNPRGARPPSSLQSSNNPRVPSRSSSKHPSKRMPPPSKNDSSSSLTLSPSLRHGQYAPAPRSSHRRASICSTAERPLTPVSRSSAKDSRSSSQNGAQSTLLQERLQRERRSEIQRNLSRLAGEMGTTTDATAVASTPARCATAAGTRPSSSQENGDAISKKKGLALKEMDQTMSTLHKQNFDLKLELFHRRERQTVLEERVEALEAAQAEADETNTELLQELEKRDKAVEEAVSMIVSLEARMELLLREREMVRQVDADNAFIAQFTQSQLTPRGHGTNMNKQDLLHANGEHNLARMPSFLSEHTENTENLRNVYLNTQGSLLSLSRTDATVGNNGFVSPDLSILSESSFLSIYGNKPAPDTPSTQVPGSFLAHESPERNGRRTVSLPFTNSRPNKPQRTEHLGSRGGAKEAIESGDVTSPLQKLVKLDTSSSATNEALQTISLGKDTERSTTARPLKPKPLLRHRSEKERERSSGKNIADDSGTHTHALPPTPDTMSSSTMNQSQNSNGVHRDQGAEETRQHPVLTRLTLDQTNEVEPGHWRFEDTSVAQPPSITAFNGRKGAPGGNYLENLLSPPRRPRSADETTISRQKNDWDSGSEPDDAVSEVSSFDYWMREGLRPSRGGQTRPQNGVSPTHQNTNRDAPDLFGFPSDYRGWQTKDMFGAVGGNQHLGARTPLAPALDALGASLPAPETGLFGSGLAGSNSPRPIGAAAAPPSAPYRRSSLQARTSAPGTPQVPRSQEKLREARSSRKNSLSGEVQSSPSGWPVPNSGSQTPTPPVRPPDQHQDGSATQKRHYPPPASQQQGTGVTRPRSRGLSSLFRRSLGASSSSHPQPSASVPNNQSAFPTPSKRNATPTAIGAPAWERRSDTTDENASVTPPPIMRKRGAGMEISTEGRENAEVPPTVFAGRARKSSDIPSSSPCLGAGLKNVMASKDGGAPLTPATPTAPPTDQAQDNAPAHGHGHGRRWFGLGRVTSSKHGGT